jgi:ferredoxin
LKVIADRELCVGAGMCVMTDSTRFDQDTDGRVIVRIEAVGPEDLEVARRAVDLCPSGALSLSDDVVDSDS